MLELPTDPMILEFYGEFVEQWINDINEQWDTLLAERITDIKSNFYRFAHTLKGSGYQFGITPLGDAGIELMALIKEGKWDACVPFKGRLLSILDEALQLYNSTQRLN